MDSKVVRIWDRQSGKPFSSVEAPPDVPFNDVAIYPNSGLMMMANEQPKMQVHYIPSMGPAPKWCSFLDNITEEIEESQVENYRLCKKTFHIFFVNSAPMLEYIRGQRSASITASRTWPSFNNRPAKFSNPSDPTNLTFLGYKRL